MITPPPSYLEITTAIPEDGCPIKCLRYCPQELISKQYTGDRWLTLDHLKYFIAPIPNTHPIFISGLCEPGVNPQLTEMLLWLHERGHPLSMFTTGYGILPHNAQKLIEIPFDKFVLHLPDAYGNAKIPQTQDYFETRSIIEMNVKHLEYMNMGWNFISNKCEDMARGKATHKTGRRLCNFLESPAYQLLPNGDVFFCCMVRGLTERVGSLYNNTYPELAAHHPIISDRLQKDPNSICHICNVSERYWVRKAIQKKNELLHDRTIMQLLGA
jgi:hypothetical protein